MKLDVIVIGLLVAMVLFVGLAGAQEMCPLSPDTPVPQTFGVTSISKQVAGVCIGNVFATENINSYIPGDYNTFTGSNMYVSTGKGVTQFAAQSDITNSESTTIQTTRAIDYNGIGASIGDEAFVAQMGSSIPEVNLTAPALNIMVESDNYGVLYSGAYGGQTFVTNSPGNTLILDYKGAVDKSLALPSGNYAHGAFTFSEGVFEQTGRVMNTSSTIPVNVTDPVTGNVTTVNQTVYENKMILDNEFSYQEMTTMIGQFILANQFKYQWAVPLT